MQLASRLLGACLLRPVASLAMASGVGPSSTILRNTSLPPSPSSALHETFACMALRSAHSLIQAMPSASGRAAGGSHGTWHVHASPYSSTATRVSLINLRDNPRATKQRMRVGRGNSSNRGNYCGRGMNGQNSRGRGAHMLFDGGQLGLLKFPVVRERPPYEVLYTQLGIGRLVEYIQLGLLDAQKVITMKDLQDVGCVGRIKYGVLLYGKVSPPFPIHIQVTACDPVTKAKVEAVGGTVTRVYYEEEGLRGLLHPTVYTNKRLPLPLPAHSWHPRYNGKFDAIGQLPPQLTPPGTARLGQAV